MNVVRKTVVSSLVTFVIISSSNLYAANNGLQSHLPEGAEVADIKVKSVGNDSYTFVKFIEKSSGEIKHIVLDSNGKSVSEASMSSNRSLIDADLQSVMDDPNSSINEDENATIKVNIALNVGNMTIDVEPESGVVTFVDGQPVITVNGKEVNEDNIHASNEKKQKAINAAAEKRNIARKNVLKTLAGINKWEGRPELADAIDNEKDTLTIDLTKSEIETLAQQGRALIDGIEIYIEPSDNISGAMLATRVNPYATSYAGRRGENIGIYMTESGCANNGHITNYMRIAGTRTDHSENVSAIMRAVSPQSYIYCRGGATLPTSTDINGYNGNPRIHVINRSNGGGDNGNFTTVDRDWDNFIYNNGIPVFNSAGNNGYANGYNVFPANGLNVISVGNYNDSNATISGSSSYKDPETGNEKPELSAPGTSITAGGHTMSGTSMSSPHAAAFSADLMSAYSWLRLKPYYIKANMLAGADDVISGGVEKVGVGGIDFYRNYYSGTNTWWEGSNSSFSYFDSNDSSPNNGYIDRQVYLSSGLSNVRVVLSWLNRGTYTYDNRAAAHPIGMDMDLSVYDPNGNYVAGSSSWDNPYEMVSFDPAVTGTYTVKIKRYANRDTSSKLHMGLSIDW